MLIQQTTKSVQINSHSHFRLLLYYGDWYKKILCWSLRRTFKNKTLFRVMKAMAVSTGPKTNTCA